uniref:Uncharacterized protein n=1 Tax=Panagrolaimus sp. ES5 TaxID=591445 RepID=A0AC34FPQ4_9BILA
MDKKMKQIYLFFLLIFTFKFVGAVEYHGNRRHWTLENDGKTYVALHVLKEETKSFNLTFPKQKTFADLASGIKLYSPTENEKCEDTNGSLGFLLTIADKNYIRGTIKTKTIGPTEFLAAFLNETCTMFRGSEHDYASPRIDVNPATLEDRDLQCFQNEPAPFQSYHGDNTKHVLELHASGDIGCQIFMELPTYMQIEDFTLPNASKLELNESFAGNDETFWWKSGNDEMLPAAVEFDGNGSVLINISKSSKENPYFFRIGQNQSLPSLQLQFDPQCIGFKFEMFLNLQDSSDCKIDIEVIANGINISTKNNGIWHEIKDPSISPTLVFGERKVYVKVASPLSIKEFETCDFKTSSDVAADQFVLQLAHDTSAIVGDCDIAQIIIPKNDFAAGIEVLIDRSKIEKNTTENETITILPTIITTEREAPGMEWWGYLVFGGMLLIIVVLIIIVVFCVCCRRRKNRKSNNSSPPKNLENGAPQSPAMKTAILKESLPKEKSKEKKKTITKTKTKEEEKVDESKKREKPKLAKPAKKNIDEPGIESFQPPPKRKLMPFKKDDDISQSDKRSAVQPSSTQNDPTTTEAASTTQQQTEPGTGTAENTDVYSDVRLYAAMNND